MKNKLLGLLLAILATVFLINSCRQEPFNVADVQNKGDYNSKFQVVNIKQIPAVETFIKKQTGRKDFKVPIAGKAGTMAKGAIPFSELETNFIIKKTTDSLVYYVFNISNAGDQSTIYNFEVKEVEGKIVRTELIEYASTTNFAKNLSNLYKFTGKVTAYDASLTIVSDEIFDSGQPQNPCTPQNPGGNGDQPVGGGLYEPVNPGDPGYPGNPQDPYNPLPPEYPSFPSYPSDGGGSSGEEPYTPPSNEGGCGSYVMTSFFYNNSNGEAVGIWENDCGHLYFGTQPQTYAIAASKLAPHCGDGSGVIVLPINPKSPCEKIKQSTEDPKYKSNITSLEGTTGQDHENGYSLGTAVPNTSQSGTQNQLLQNFPQTKEVKMTIFSNTFALMHTHYDGLYPIFSPGDIILFNRWIVWANGWNAVPTNVPKIPLNNLTLTLVTSNGNYLLAFDGTQVDDLPTYSDNELNDLNKDYMKRMNNAVSIANVSGNINYDMEKLEKEFLTFANQKMNMTGLKLYRVKNDGNYEISLNNLKGVKCP